MTTTEAVIEVTQFKLLSKEHAIMMVASLLSISYSDAQLLYRLLVK